MKQSAGPLRLLAFSGLVALGLLPLLAPLSAVSPLFAPLERACGAWFDLHCHRDPARSLQLFGAPLSVCARCSGIYFGLGAGAALRRPRLEPRALRLWVLAAAALMLLDVLLEARSLHGAWPALRLGTGALLAYPVGTALGRLALGQATSTARPAQSP